MYWKTRVEEQWKDTERRVSSIRKIEEKNKSNNRWQAVSHAYVVTLRCSEAPTVDPD
jgi:hypothetical protein